MTGAGAVLHHEGASVSRPDGASESRHETLDASRQEGHGISQIARGSALNLLGAAIYLAATLGATVVVTREFSRPVAGAFFAATSLFLILEEFAVLGADNGLVYYIARLRSIGAQSEIRPVLRTAMAPVVVASLIAAALVVAFAHPLASALLAGRGGGGASLTEVADALRALAVALPFAALVDTMLGATRGYRDMRPTTAIDRTGRSSLQLIAVCIAAALGATALLAPLWALAYVPTAAAAWIALRRIGRRTRQVAIAPPRAASASDSPATPARFWRFTAPRALAMGAQVVIQRLDIVLVGVMRGPTDAAIYTAATRFLIFCQFGNAAVSMASQPQFSHLFARRARAAASAVYKTTTAWLVLLIWPLSLLALNYGHAILGVFGHSYGGGSEAMAILAGSMLFASVCGSVDVVLVTTGRSALSLFNGLVALAVNVGIDVALIPRYGITGAAIGWAAAIAASNLLPLFQVHRIVHINPFGKATLLAGALAAVSFGLLPVLVRLAFGHGAAPSLAATAGGCALLVAGVWHWREQLQLSLVASSRGFRGRLVPAFLLRTTNRPETT